MNRLLRFTLGGFYLSSIIYFFATILYGQWWYTLLFSIIFVILATYAQTSKDFQQEEPSTQEEKIINNMARLQNFLDLTTHWNKVQRERMKKSSNGGEGETNE